MINRYMHWRIQQPNNPIRNPIRERHRRRINAMISKMRHKYGESDVRTL